MASISKSIGSSVWVQKERSQCAELTEEYIEEFAYCAQNDLRWINAHMDELLNSDKLSVKRHISFIRCADALLGILQRCSRHRVNYVARHRAQPASMILNELYVES